jgi:uncharacterized protein YdiU (UPF0061 family)
MQNSGVDYSLFFRRLGEQPKQASLACAMTSSTSRVSMPGASYIARVARDGDWKAQRRARMHAVNPLYILRNYLAQKAIDAAEQAITAKCDGCMRC